MCLEKTEEKTLKPQNEDMQYTLKDRKAVITHPKNEVNGNQETSQVNKVSPYLYWFYCFYKS